MHPLGTDELGRDVLLRLLGGGRVSLVDRHRGGTRRGGARHADRPRRGLSRRLDRSGTDARHRRDHRVAAAAVADRAGRARSATSSACRERSPNRDEISLFRIVALAVLVGWTTAARLVRGATLVTRSRDFVRAARSLGAGVPHILWRTYPAECARTADRRDDAQRRRRDPARIGAELSRARRPAAAGELGQHAEQCPGADRHGAAAGGLPRADDLPDRRRLQPAGRRFAAAARSGGGEQALVDKEKPPRGARR